MYNTAILGTFALGARGRLALGVSLLLVGLSACAPPKLIDSPANIHASEAAPVALADDPSLGPVLRMGPVLDGAVGPVVVDDGARTAMLLAQPKPGAANGEFRVELGVETAGATVVRGIGDTLQPPRGLALALSPAAGLALWIEGTKRAVVVAVALGPDGTAMGLPRILPQGRSAPPYWVAAKVAEGQRVAFVAEQDAGGAVMRARLLGDDGAPSTPPVTLAKKAVAWAVTPSASLVVIREDGGYPVLEAVDVDGKGAPQVLASARVEGVAVRSVSRIDVSGRGAAELVAVTLSAPSAEVLVFRKQGAGFVRVERLEGRVVAGASSAEYAGFLLAKAFPSAEGAVDLVALTCEGGAMVEHALPESAGAGEATPASLTIGDQGDVMVADGRETSKPMVLRVSSSGGAQRQRSATGLSQAWNLRWRGGELRLTRFEAKGSAAFLTDGPMVFGAAEEAVLPAPSAREVQTHFRAPTPRIAAASLEHTTYVLRLEQLSEVSQGDDVNAQSLRLVALRAGGDGGRGEVTKDDRLTDRAQPMGSIHVTTAKGDPRVIAATWLAREKGVQQGHGILLSAESCKGPTATGCAGRADAWPLPRRRHRQLTKAAGDVTELVLAPTGEGYVAAWIEQIGQESAVIAATYDPGFERTSRFERVSAAGSQASDLAATVRGSGVWLAWIDAKGSSSAATKAVPTVARVGAHDARVELKSTGVSRGDGLAGALGIANHENGILVVYIEREDDGAARVADDAGVGAAYLTMALVNDRGETVGDPVNLASDGEGVLCDVALSPTTLAVERCRPAAFSLETAQVHASKEGVRLGPVVSVTRGLRPATQDRPLAIDHQRLLWLQNDEAGNPWLRSLPLRALRQDGDAVQK